MDHQIYYGIKLTLFLIIILCISSACSAGGNFCGSGSGGFMLTPNCPDVIDINITLSNDNTSANFTVIYLYDIAMCDCTYNYTISFLAPDNQLLNSSHGILQDEQASNGMLMITSSPHPTFVKGITILINLTSTNGSYITSNIIVPGTYDPSLMSLNFVNSTNTSILLSWQLLFPLAEPDVYNIEYNYTQLTGASRVSNITSVQINGDSEAITSMNNIFYYELVDLIPYTNYDVSVSVTYGTITSSASSVTATTQQGVSSKVVNISIVAEENMMLLIAWNEPLYPAGIIDRYEITLFSDLTLTVNTSNLSAKALFQYNVNYSISITSFNSFGQGETTTVFVIVRAPTPPLNFILSPISSNELQASWQEPIAPNGVLNVLTNYTIFCNISSNQFYSELLSSPDYMNSTTADNTVFTLTGLAPFTNYICYVTASNGGGESGPSNNSTARTNETIPSDLPRGFNVSDKTSTTISLEWTRPATPNGIITAYHLQYTDRLQYTNVSVTIPTIFVTDNDEYNVTSYIVDNLNEFTNYTFTLYPVTNSGNGPSTTISAVTNEAAPSSSPRDISGINSSSSSILVSWKPPEDNDQNGIINGYNITYFMLPNGTINYIDTSSLSFNITGLMIYTEYNISVAAYTSIGTGPSISIVVRTDSSVPTPPLNLRYRNISSSSIELSWDPPNSFRGPNEGYQVMYTRVETGYTQTMSDITSTSVNITDLQIYEEYTITVVALSDKGIGETSVPLTVITDEDSPTPPLDFTLVPISSNELQASWQEPTTLNGVLTIYTIFCRISSDQFYSELLSATDYMNTTIADNTVLTLTGLVPFTNYICYVTASNGGGESGPSNNSTARTNETIPSDPPRGFNVSDKTSTSISLEWTRPAKPNGIITAYRLQYTDHLQYTNVSVTIPTMFVTDNDEYNVTSYIVDNLNEFTNYTFTLYPVTNSGDGPPTTVSAVTNEAAPSSPPRDISGINSSSSSILVSWKPPEDNDQNGIINGYNITYFMLPNGIINYIDTSSLSFNITGLMIYTEYNISVAAYTSIGTGPSISIVVRTDSSVPTAPLNLRYRNISSSSIELSWDPPDNFRGPNEGYQVMYTRVETGYTQTMSDITSTSVNITDLQIYEEYTITVVALSDKGIGETSVPLTVITDEDSPTPPLGFTLIPISSNELQASWQEPTTLNGVLTIYTIFCRISSDQFYSELLSATDYMNTTIADNTVLTLTGLMPFTNYICYVRASNGGGESGPSNNSTARTNETIPSDPPRGFNVSDKTSTTISLEWTRPATPNGIITAYRLQYINESVTIPTIFVKDNDEYNVTSYIVHNLNEFTNYTFTLYPVTNSGDGPLTAISAVTNEAAPSSPPRDISGINSSSSSILVSWKPPEDNDQNGIINGYNISYFMLPNGTINYIDTSSLSFNITGLMIYTEYNISVAAYTSIGTGPSISVVVRTDSSVPTAPLNLRYRNISSSSIELSWDPPNNFRGPNEGYQVMYTRVETGYTQTMSDITSTSVNITDLQIYEEYTITVVALSDKGIGETSVPLTVITDEDLPGLVSNFSAYEINLTAIAVEWRAPVEPNGIITIYEVEYSDTNTTYSETFSASTFVQEPFRIILSGLQTFTEYDIRVRAFTNQGHGEFTNVMIVRTDPSSASPPTSITTSVSKRFIVLSWSKPDRPNGVIVGYYIKTNATLPTDIPTINNSMILNFTGDVLSINFTGLVPYTVYDFSIAAYSFQYEDDNNPFAIITGIFSKLMTATTSQDAPTPPLDFTLIPISSNKLQASWQEPMTLNGVLTIYTIFCRISSDQFYSELLSAPDYMNTITADNTVFTLTGLVPFTNYICYVTASNGGGESGPSNNSTARTNETIPSDPPRGFNVSDKTSNSISLEWTRPATPNGIITAYRLQYTNVSVTIPTMFVTDNDEYNVTSYIVDNLNEFTNYTFTLYPVTNSGNGPSTTVSAVTNEAAPSSPPRDISGINSSSSSILVSWKPPEDNDQNGIINGYNISYFMLPNGTINYTDTSSLSFNITGLMIYTEYSISVAAYTSIGTGPSISIVVRTDSSVPTPPLNLRYRNISSSSIELSWDPPNSFRGPNEGYQVMYTRVETGYTQTMSDITSTSVNITDLQIYEEYTITVVALTDKGIGETSVPLTVITDEDLPASPDNVTLTTINSTALHLSWLPPLDPNGIIGGYYISYQLDVLDQQYLLIPPMVTNTQSDVLNLLITDLHPFAVYVIEIRAFTAIGNGTVYSVTGMTEQYFPTMGVSNLTVTPINSTSVEVSWSPPPLSDWNGILVNYEIAYQTNDANIDPPFTNSSNLLPSDFSNSDDPKNVSNSKNTTTYFKVLTPLGSLVDEFIIITNLHEYINYTFSVTVATSVGPNPQSLTPTLSLTTLQSVPSGPPTNVTVQVINSSAADISWGLPPYLDRNGIITYYLINIDDTLKRFPRLVNVTGTSYTANNLPQYSVFNVSVASATDVGLGPFSSSVSDMTFEGLPSAPNVTTTEIDPTTIQVSWNKPEFPNGIVLGYHIFYIGQKDNPDTVFEGLGQNMSRTVSDIERAVNLTNLIADSYYNINVTAYTRVGNGTPGIGQEIKLPPGPPPPVPTNITITTPPTDGTTTMSPNSIRIDFVIPESLNINGAITRARVLVRTADSRNDTITNYYYSNLQPANEASVYQALEISMSDTSSSKRQSRGQMISETIGDESVECGPNDTICNGPLRPDTSYQFKYRAYTSNDDSVFVESEYSDPLSTGSIPFNNTSAIVIAIVIVIIIIALTILVVVVLVFVVRKRRRSKYSFVANGKENLIISNEKSPKLVGSMPLTSTDPTIVPLTDVVTNTTVVRTHTVKATPNSHKVYIRDFVGYVNDMLSDSGFKFSEEYEKVSNVGLDHSKDASLLPENRAKNRYTNILAYDHSRVKLDSIDDEPGSDYVNANYIPGYRMRRAYIATQGPLPSTFDDFWRMIWEQNCYNIVMLTQLVERGRTKCHRYWPGSQPEVYGEISVDMLSEQEETDWVIRKFKLTKEKRSRVVMHYQFTSWPDHGVPESPSAALDFVKVVHEVVQPAHGPVVVHCSAGVGRTGTFIALGSLLQHIKDHDWVDIFGLASEMRQHRNHMVQTEAQYVFIHKAMMEVCETRSSYNKPFGNFNVVSPMSQLSDPYGDMLSEEVTKYHTPSISSGSGYVKRTNSYEESKF